MEEKFSVNLLILENYKYYSLQRGKNAVFRRRMTISRDKKKNELILAITLQFIRTLKNYRDARERKRLVISSLMHFITPYIHI